MDHKEPKKNNQNNKKKKSKKNEDSISSLWDNFRWSTILIIGVPEGKEEEQEIGHLFEKIVKENFPNLVKEIDMRVQDAQRIPNNIHTKGPTLRHIIIKMPKIKDKERILKAVRKKALSYLWGEPIRLSAEFSKETAG